VTARSRGDDGFVGGFAGLLFGMLLFVAGTLLAAYAWGVVDTKSATTEAARQAARTFVEAPDAATATAEADQAAYAALGGYGRDPARARVDISSGPFVRCTRVTVTVTYPAPLLDLPFVGRLGTGQQVRADHSELIDPYRSGLAGVATC
jgi:Flp pilus assembly protein TadG